ncbi:U-box domain-containing protein 62-like [Cynara cardunculus var. scolymus]|uniref:Zinc finger, RING/FYVE/PHD-type n=1 Tax=Cynara cardunculus var. scolymus TaxID=59895 RepID=A0A103YJ35_CYNCS|nr:U-box domain-containing protein 62-like [Cynara cardunculus var. scolymus]KVI10014.1 Zinc finger, RING/FYVE/PHD-type [Cynara cardunculus var. scolymus]
MASEEIALVLSHRSDNNHPQFLFQDESNLPFRCNPPQHHQQQRHTSGHHPAGHTTNNKTTRELTGFIEHQNRHYQPQATTDFRRSICDAAPAYHRGIQDWDIRNGRDSSSPSGDGSDSDDDGDGDDDEMDDGDGDGDDHVVGLVNSSNDIKNARKSNVSGHSSCVKNGNGKRTHLSSIGSSSEVMKEGIVIQNHQQTQLCQYQNAITVADPNGELYYSQYLRGAEGSGAGLKDMLVENGCGFSGRKDISNSGGSGESLRAILSDPLTGGLMDDAMILPCGHSFGSGGMQHVMRMKACYTCSHMVSEGSVTPNLSLRSAVLAFRREEELQTHRASKRRNRLEQDKSNYGDSTLMDQSKGRGVQFPFFVTDRVIIKGNKRTPPRFVGREAVVTTQCLNGWYVVKTLDNAESVKLQYRSLAKVEDARPLEVGSSKMTPPNWL